MKKYFIIIAILAGILVFTVAANLFSTVRQHRQQQQQAEAHAKATATYFQRVNADTVAFKNKIVLKGLQLEKNGVKGEDLARALSAEEAKERVEYEQKMERLRLERLRADERQ